MARYEATRTTDRRERGWEVYEHEDGGGNRLVASFLETHDAERVTALLNATRPSCAGGTLTVLTATELDAVMNNVSHELTRRHLLERDDKPTAPDTGNDTLDALDPAGYNLPVEDAEPWEESPTANHLVPKVGAGATVGVGSDSYPYTVVSVSPSGHQLKLCRDDYRLRSGSFQTGDAVPEYRPGEPSAIEVATRRTVGEDGKPEYRLRGHDRRSGYVAVGRRRWHSDPSF